MNNHTITLSNGVKMPSLIHGLPLICGLDAMSKKDFMHSVLFSIGNGLRGIDTSHDYGKSEKYLADVIKEAERSHMVKREDLFITSKIGNWQQECGNIESYVIASLKMMNIEYIDLMLLHWPYRDVYLKNWKKLEQLYNKGLIKAIGMANCRQRHIEKLLSSGITVQPHVMQFEYHPFRTVPSLVSYCRDHNMAIQAYSALCMWAPFVPANIVLREMAEKYDRSIAQIMLRWSTQMGNAPVFRSYSEKHIKEILDIFDFKISDDDINKISSLNINYKYHPESLNCPGY